MKYLILHKCEWERLKRQHEPHKIPPKDNEYLQRLHELSQKWIRSWPDTVQGHMEIVNNSKTTKKEKMESEIKKFALRKTEDISTPAILRARKLIFDKSCYGSQLISSLLESKTFEEREAQIKFHKELKQNLAAKEKEKSSKEGQHCWDFINNEKEKLKKRKDKEYQIGTINKNMFNMKRKMRALEQHVEKQKEIQDLQLIKELIKRDEEHEDSSKCLREQYQECIELKDEIKASRAKEQEIEDRINRVWQEYGDKMRCMEKFMCEKIRRGTPDALKKQKVYQMLEGIKEEEKNKYNAFVEKGIREHERMLLKENEVVIRKQDDTKEKYFRPGYKKTNSGHNSMKPICCDRQTLFCISKKEKKFLPESQMGKQSPNFLQPSKSLLEKLKIREKETSPYNGTEAMHEQFATEASKILQECKHKRMTQKVIDGYKKVNCLNDGDLKIMNY